MMSVTKTIAIVLLIFNVVSVNGETSEVNFDWLLGQWQRTNEQAGRQTFEAWEKRSATEYVGVSYTLHEGKNIWQENMRLLRSENEWRLIIQLVGESAPVEFTLTEISASHFVSENPTHDFPTLIQYKIDKSNLRASIAGGDTEIKFDYIPAAAQD